MEIEWNEEVELPVVRCPVCEKNGLKNDEDILQPNCLYILKVGHTKR
jgi:hypothetical protein